MQRDTLTPLDARNSLLLDRSKTANSDFSDSFSINKTGFGNSMNATTMKGAGDVEAARAVPVGSASPEDRGFLSAGGNPLFAPRGVTGGGAYRPLTPSTPFGTEPTRTGSRDELMGGDGVSGGDMRQPTLPSLSEGGWNRPGYARPSPSPAPGYGGGNGGGYGYGGYNQGRGGY